MESVDRAKALLAFAESAIQQSEYSERPLNELRFVRINSTSVSEAHYKILEAVPVASNAKETECTEQELSSIPHNALPKPVLSSKTSQQPAVAADSTITNRKRTFDSQYSNFNNAKDDSLSQESTFSSGQRYRQSILSPIAYADIDANRSNIARESDVSPGIDAENIPHQMQQHQHQLKPNQLTHALDHSYTSAHSAEVGRFGIWLEPDLRRSQDEPLSENLMATMQEQEHSEVFELSQPQKSPPGRVLSPEFLNPTQDSMVSVGLVQSQSKQHLLRNHCYSPRLDEYATLHNTEKLEESQDSTSSSMGNFQWEGLQTHPTTEHSDRLTIQQPALASVLYSQQASEAEPLNFTLPIVLNAQAQTQGEALQKHLEELYQTSLPPTEDAYAPAALTHTLSDSCPLQESDHNDILLCVEPKQDMHLSSALPLHTQNKRSDHINKREGDEVLWGVENWPWNRTDFIHIPVSTRTTTELEHVSTIGRTCPTTPQAGRQYVVYWCTSCMRVNRNAALDCAIKLSNHLQVPMLVVITIEASVADCMQRLTAERAKDNFTKSMIDANRSGSSASKTSVPIHSTSWFSKWRSAQGYCAAVAKFRFKLKQMGVPVVGYITQSTTTVSAPGHMPFQDILTKGLGIVNPKCLLTDDLYLPTKRAMVSCLGKTVALEKSVIVALDNDSFFPDVGSPSIPSAVGPSDGHCLPLTVGLVKEYEQIFRQNLARNAQCEKSEPNEFSHSNDKPTALDDALKFECLPINTETSFLISDSQWSQWEALEEIDASSWIVQNIFAKNTICVQNETQATAALQVLQTEAAWQSQSPSSSCWGQLLVGAEYLWLKGLLPPTLAPAMALNSNTPERWESIALHLARVDYCRRVSRNWGKCKQDIKPMQTFAQTQTQYTQVPIGIPDRRDSGSNPTWLDLCPELLPLLRTATSRKCSTGSNNAIQSDGTKFYKIPEIPYPFELCGGKTADKLFNSLQLCLIDTGAIPKGIAAEYWIGTFLHRLPSAEMGLQIAILEASRHSLLPGDEIATVILPLLISVIEFLQGAQLGFLGMEARLRQLDHQLRQQLGSLPIDQFCCSFC